MEFTIDQMLPQEAGAVARLIRETVEPLPYYNYRAKEEEIEKYSERQLLDMLRDDPASVILARDGSTPVGFILSYYDDGIIWLSWFGVAKQARKQGIGKALLKALASTLGKRRSHKVWCDTRTDNFDSQRVLKDAGFRQIAELKNHWYGQDFYLWEWYPN